MCVWNKQVKPKTREGGIRIQFNSKSLVKRLIEYFGIPYNRGKCYTVTIPKQLSEDWSFAKHTLRGLIDTDGSIFVARKPGVPKYPSIELTTDSQQLAIQVRNLLLSQGFRVPKIWSYCSENSTHKSFKVALNGKRNLNKWLEEIGFSNPYKLNRAINALG